MVFYAWIGYPKSDLPKIRVPLRVISTRTKIWVWVGLGWVGFVSEFHGYFRVGYPKSSKLRVLGARILGKTKIIIENC